MKTKTDALAAIDDLVADREEYCYRSDHDFCNYAEPPTTGKPACPSCGIGQIFAAWGIDADTLLGIKGPVPAVFGYGGYGEGWTVGQIAETGFFPSDFRIMHPEIRALGVTEPAVRVLWAFQGMQDRNGATWGEARDFAREVAEQLGEKN